MSIKELPYRQVHLDFHTSPAIPSVGKRFSKEQFAEALKRGHVNSVTLFSKCHHGYSYHPTEVNEMHPGLHFDLLGSQLEVCRELGINAPVYISAGFDEKEVIRHPEWISVGAPGHGPDYVNDSSYHLLCYNTPYLDKLLAQIEEVMKKYSPIELFLDISAVRVCYCASCVSEMKRRGLNPHNPADSVKMGEITYANYCRKTEEIIHRYNPETKIFHNAGNIQRGRRDIAGYDSHLELESLPTGGWGYDHFPMSASYVRNIGKDYLGMTGKFHTTWGEFGGFKHPNALRYEVALSAAFGAKCSIGDQLHPSGEMNLRTYDLIGKAYAELEKIEPWCVGAKAVTDIAVLSAEAVSGTNSRDSKPDIGVCRMLFEGKYLFDLIDLEVSFDRYKVIVLPDTVTVNGALEKRLKDYLEKGGKLLCSGYSGLGKDGNSFVLPLGAEKEGLNEFRPTYMVPCDERIATNGITQYVMYTEAQNIKAKENGKVFARLAEPYFNRTPEHFCSHQHTPDRPDSRRDGAVLTDNTAYICWNIFTDYATKGSLVLKELFIFALENLLGNSKTVEISGLPDRGKMTLMRQKKENRDILHLLFAHTTVRGNGIEVIEDVVPVCDIGVSLKTEKKPLSVLTVPDKKTLKYVYADGKVSFTVPEVYIHTAVEIAYE